MNPATSKQVVLNFFTKFLDRGSIINTSCGGLAIHDNANFKDEIVYIKSDTEIKMLADRRYDATRPLGDVVKDDFCACFWNGFEDHGIKAMIHTASPDALIVSKLYNNGDLIPLDHKRSFISRPWDRTIFLWLKTENLGTPLNNRVILGACANLVRGHGVFVWANSADLAIKRCEAIENYFKYLIA